MFLHHFRIVFYYFLMQVHMQKGIIMTIKRLELILRKIWVDGQCYFLETLRDSSMIK